MVSRSELATRLARNGASHAQAAHAVDAVLHEITAALVAGERVALTGFGTFEPVARPERTARNPRTGAAVQVPAATVARFHAGAGLRHALVVGDAGAAPGGSLPATRAGGSGATEAALPAQTPPVAGEGGVLSAPAPGAAPDVTAKTQRKGASSGKAAKAAKPAKDVKKTHKAPSKPGTSKSKKGSGGKSAAKKVKGKH